MNDVVVLSLARTPIGALGGALATATAPQLGGVAVAAALQRANIAGSQVSGVILGHVLSAGTGQAPARQAAFAAGLPVGVPAFSVNKVCGSGMAALMLASQAIRAGDSEIVVAGGQESMSRAPYLLPEARQGYRLGNQTVVDSMIHDGLWDPYDNTHMGNLAELCAREHGFARERQDAFAAESFRRARAAQADGAFAAEIAPVTLALRKGETSTVSLDEGPARFDLAKMATLRPAFASNGTITAANASTISDGAAALVLASAAHARALGLTPLARIVACSTHAQAPQWFTTAPAEAIRMAVKKAGWQLQDVDLFEINEAFAVVAMAAQQDLDIGHDRLNIHGGAIALGHPIGASGARLVVTLIAALRAQGKTRGVAAVCIGGGEAMALCVEIMA